MRVVSRRIVDFCFSCHVLHRFKLFLEPRALRDGAIDPRLPSLPVCKIYHNPSVTLTTIFNQPGKKAIDLIVDFLSCMWEYAKEQITREIGAVADLDSADVWLTVPAAWDAKGCEIMGCGTCAVRGGRVDPILLKQSKCVDLAYSFCFFRSTYQHGFPLRERGVYATATYFNPFLGLT